MLEIDRLSLRLPAGFETRAAGIARQVAEALGDLPGLPSRRLEHLRVPPVNIMAGSSDAQIAEQIATSIHEALGGGNSGCSM